MSSTYDGRNFRAELTWNKLWVDEMSVDEMSVDEMSVDEMSVDEMSVDEMSVDEMSSTQPKYPAGLAPVIEGKDRHLQVHHVGHRAWEGGGGGEFMLWKH